MKQQKEIDCEKVFRKFWLFLGRAEGMKLKNTFGRFGVCRFLADVFLLWFATYFFSIMFLLWSVSVRVFWIMPIPFVCDKRNHDTPTTI